MQILKKLHWHPTGNFGKKTWKQQQSVNKAFWSHFKHFGRLLGKMYLFLTPSKTDGSVPSQQGAPTTCNQTYWEVSQQTYFQTLITGQFELVWVWSKGNVQSFSGGGREAHEFRCGLRAKLTLQWGEGEGGRGFWEQSHSSYSIHQIPSDSLNCSFPRNPFLPKTNNFSTTCQPAKIFL